MRRPRSPIGNSVTFVVASVVLLAVGAVQFGVASTASADPTPIDRPAGCCASAVRVDPPDPSRRAETLGLVGDSLSVGITDDRFQIGPPIQDVIASQGRSMWTATTVGMNTSTGVDVLSGRADQVAGTDVVVIALGTNDLVGGTDRTGWRRAVDRITGEVFSANPGAVVVWVDLDFPRLALRADAFNSVLREAAASERDLAVCDWSSAVSANRQWVGSDGLHLNGTGYAARRDLIIACIDEIRLT